MHRTEEVIPPSVPQHESTIRGINQFVLLRWRFIYGFCVFIFALFFTKASHNLVKTASNILKHLSHRRLIIGSGLGSFSPL